MVDSKSSEIGFFILCNKNQSAYLEKKRFVYPSHFKMQDLAGIRNVFRQGID
jgi:hypothetical protein